MPDSLATTAEAGDRLATLKALRDRLAAEIDECESKRDTAALSQRLMDVLEQIDTAEKAQPEKKGTPRDEVARKRRERASTSRPRRAAGK